MYDLRYAAKDKTHSPNIPQSVPVVSYAGHRNRGDTDRSLGLGFDVSPDGTIIAAGSGLLYLPNFLAGDDRIVRLWSVNSGQRIHSRLSEHAFENQVNGFENHVVGLQFSRKVENGIYIAGHEVEFWSI